MRSPVMLFKPGSETIIWDIHLDTLVVDEHEVPDYLAAGWYSHPWEVRDSVMSKVSEKIETSPEHVDAVIIDKPRRGRPPKAKETP